MENNFPLKNQAPSGNQENSNSDYEKKLADLLKRKEELAILRKNIREDIEQREKALAEEKRALVQADIERRQIALDQRKQEVETITKKTSQSKRILSGIKDWIGQNLRKTVGVTALAAASVALASGQFGEHKKTSKNFEMPAKEIAKTDSMKRLEIKNLAGPILERIDSDMYDDLGSDTAKKAYLSFIEKDIQDSIAGKSDSACREGDPLIVSEEDLFSHIFKKFESGGNYGFVNDSSGALGAYQFLPSWIKQINLRPGNDSDEEFFLKHPDAQEHLFKIAFNEHMKPFALLHATRKDGTLDSVKYKKLLLAVYFVGPGKALQYGTPEGDEIPPKNTISLNQCVDQRYADLVKVENAIKGGGRCLFDNSNEEVVDRWGKKRMMGRLYFVDNNYHTTYSMRMPQVIEEDKNLQYINPIGGEDVVSKVTVVFNYLREKDSTANSIEEQNKVNKKTKPEHLKPKKHTVPDTIEEKGSEESVPAVYDSLYGGSDSINNPDENS